MDEWMADRGGVNIIAGYTSFHTQIQRSRVPDLPFHAGFEVCCSLLSSPPPSFYLHTTLQIPFLFSWGNQS